MSTPDTRNWLSAGPLRKLTEEGEDSASGFSMFKTVFFAVVCAAGFFGTLWVIRKTIGF